MQKLHVIQNTSNRQASVWYVLEDKALYWACSASLVAPILHYLHYTTLHFCPTSTLVTQAHHLPPHRTRVLYLQGDDRGAPRRTFPVLGGRPGTRGPTGKIYICSLYSLQVRLWCSPGKDSLLGRTHWSVAFCIPPTTYLWDPTPASPPYPTHQRPLPRPLLPDAVPGTDASQHAHLRLSFKTQVFQPFTRVFDDLYWSFKCL